MTIVSIHGRKLGFKTSTGNLVQDGKELLTTLQKDFTLSSAQILALNGTPFSLVSAPGSGRLLIPAALYLFMDYNSTAYDGVASGEDLAVRYTDGSGNIALTVETTGFLDQTTDQYRWAQQGSPAATGGGFAPTANAALVAHMTTGNIATGNSPVYGRLYYYNVPATLPTPVG